MLVSCCVRSGMILGTIDREVAMYRAKREERETETASASGIQCRRELLLGMMWLPVC